MKIALETVASELGQYLHIGVHIPPHHNIIIKAVVWSDLHTAIQSPHIAIVEREATKQSHVGNDAFG